MSKLLYKIIFSVVVVVCIFFLGVYFQSPQTQADALISIHTKKLMERDALDEKLLTLSENKLVPLNAKYDEDMLKLANKYDPKIDRIYEQMDIIDNEIVVITEELIGLQQSIQASCLLWDSASREFVDDDHCRDNIYE